MTLAISLRQVASVLEAVERAQCNDIEVLPREGEFVNEQQVSTDVDVRIPIADLTTDDAQAASVDVTDAELTDTGFEFRMSIRATGDDGDLQDSTATTNEANGEHMDGKRSSDAVDSADSGPMDDEGSPAASKTGTQPETTETDGGAVQEQPVDVADQPPYRDPDALRRVYDEYNTFAEMTDALDADVTPQTVRRHMIKHGIHDPSSVANRTNGDSSVDEQAGKGDANDAREQVEDRQAPDTEVDGPSPEDHDPVNTSIDAEAQTEVPESKGEQEPEGSNTDPDPSPNSGSGSAEDQDAFIDGQDGSAEDQVASLNGDIDAAELAEGIDLPEGMTLEQLTTAVQTSKTLFEIHRELGIDQDHAREVLRELNLLELVHGRVSTIAETETTEDEIEERIRAAVVGNSE